MSTPTAYGDQLAPVKEALERLRTASVNWAGAFLRLEGDANPSEHSMYFSPGMGFKVHPDGTIAVFRSADGYLARFAKGGRAVITIIPEAEILGLGDDYVATVVKSIDDYIS